MRGEQSTSNVKFLGIHLPKIIKISSFLTELFKADINDITFLKHGICAFMLAVEHQYSKM